jgi:hypothetical protein
VPVSLLLSFRNEDHIKTDFMIYGSDSSELSRVKE